MGKVDSYGAALLNGKSLFACFEDDMLSSVALFDGRETHEFDVPYDDVKITDAAAEFNTVLEVIKAGSSTQWLTILDYSGKVSHRLYAEHFTYFLRDERTNEEVVLNRFVDVFKELSK